MGELDGKGRAERAAGAVVIGGLDGRVRERDRDVAGMATQSVQVPVCTAAGQDDGRAESGELARHPVGRSGGAEQGDGLVAFGVTTVATGRRCSR